MKIKVNGKEEVFDNADITLKELLVLCRVESPDTVTVQLNGEFVKTALLTSTHIKEQDEVDFLYFMGGGEKKSKIKTKNSK